MKEVIIKPNLLGLRLGKGWSQQQAADYIGISRSYYGMVETNGRAPSVAVAKKLAKVFLFDWRAFFDDDSDAQPDFAYRTVRESL